MDHVRGSSLVWPETLETLRPFILTWWSGRTVDDMPSDIKAIHDTASLKGKHINIALVVLDENGKHLRNSIPEVRPGKHRFDPELQGKDFKRQLDSLVKGLALPKVDTKPKLTLPGLCTEGQPNGVRIYLTAAENRLNHYRTPIVEAVPINDAIRKTLEYPDSSRTLNAHDLKPWLEQVYPAAIMDGKGGFRAIDGKLKFMAAGSDEMHRFAVIRGEVNFELDNSGRTRYCGDLAIVLKYPPTASKIESLRGVIDCVVPKGPERIKLAVAIESLPN